MLFVDYAKDNCPLCSATLLTVVNNSYCYSCPDCSKFTRRFFLQFGSISERKCYYFYNRERVRSQWLFYILFQDNSLILIDNINGNVDLPSPLEFSVENVISIYNNYESFRKMSAVFK